MSAWREGGQVRQNAVVSTALQVDCVINMLLSALTTLYGISGIVICHYAYRRVCGHVCGYVSTIK